MCGTINYWTMCPCNLYHCNVDFDTNFMLKYSYINCSVDLINCSVDHLVLYMA